MYLTHNEDKWVVAESFIRILKGKIYKTMKVNDSKSYFSYLNKLVDQYNRTYHRSIGKKTWWWLSWFELDHWIDSWSS